MSDIPHHTDTGCDVSPSCLSCPLPVCKFENRLFAGSEEKRQLYANVYKARLTGVKVNDLAVMFNVAPRTVSRIISKKGLYGNGASGSVSQGVSGAVLAEKKPSAVKRRCPMPSIGDSHSVRFDRPAYITYLKACPRADCNGDVQLLPGELSCLQCGWVAYGSSKPALERTA